MHNDNLWSSNAQKWDLSLMIAILKMSVYVVISYLTIHSPHKQRTGWCDCLGLDRRSNQTQQYKASINHYSCFHFVRVFFQALFFCVFVEIAPVWCELDLIFCIGVGAVRPPITTENFTIGSSKYLWVGVIWMPVKSWLKREKFTTCWLAACLIKHLVCVVANWIDSARTKSPNPKTTQQSKSLTAPP